MMIMWCDIFFKFYVAIFASKVQYQQLFTIIQLICSHTGLNESIYIGYDAPLRNTRMPFYIKVKFLSLLNLFLRKPYLYSQIFLLTHEYLLASSLLIWRTFCIYGTYIIYYCIRQYFVSFCNCYSNLNLLKVYCIFEDSVFFEDSYPMFTILSLIVTAKGIFSYCY